MPTEKSCEDCPVWPAIQDKGRPEEFLAFSETVFPSHSKPLLHLFFFLQNFFPAWATVLQIFLAEAFDLGCAGAWINADFVTKCLQFFG